MSHDIESYCKTCGMCMTSKDMNSKLTGLLHSLPIPNRPWQSIGLDFMPKAMAHAFKIRFWETFNAPRTYDILTDNLYKLPNSNDGCMRLRAPTTCPEWNKGTEEDEKVLHWLSQNAWLTSECVTEVIKLFARRRSENAISGKTWNEAAKRAAVKQVTQPPPRPSRQ